MKKINHITNKLEIILISKNENTRNRYFINKYNISKILENNENILNQILNEIYNNKTELDFNKEIEKLENILSINNKYNKSGEILKRNNFKKVISITGAYGSGKSLITAMFGKASKNLKIKTIIIDFDI